LEWALTGGDDYQLCFTVAPEQADMLNARAKKQGMDITWVGEMIDEPGIVDAKTNKPFSFDKTGFSHF